LRFFAAAQLGRFLAAALALLPRLERLVVLHFLALFLASALRASVATPPAWPLVPGDDEASLRRGDEDELSFSPVVPPVAAAPVPPLLPLSPLPLPPPP
jgi:hypothetical protein